MDGSDSDGTNALLGQRPNILFSATCSRLFRTPFSCYEYYYAREIIQIQTMRRESYVLEEIVQPTPAEIALQWDLSADGSNQAIILRVI